MKEFFFLHHARMGHMSEREVFLMVVIHCCQFHVVFNLWTWPFLLP